MYFDKELDKYILHKQTPVLLGNGLHDYCSLLLRFHCGALKNNSGPLSVFATALNYRELSRKIIDLFSKVFSLDEIILLRQGIFTGDSYKPIYLLVYFITLLLL